MPLYKEHRWNEFQLVIWKIDEEDFEDFDLEQLSEEDKARLQAIKNQKRRSEFLAARLGLMHLIDDYPKLSYTPKGAPKLPNWEGVSISHNAEYAAVIVSKCHRVGIDLEAYRKRMTQLGSRYLSEPELHAIGPSPEIETLAAYWSAKECMIKLNDAPELDLRKEIRIAPLLLGTSAMGRALVIHNQKTKLLPLYFKMEKDFCLCFSYD